MSTLAPTGSFAAPLSKLRRMVSLSKTFQDATGTTNAVDAEKRVFLKDVSQGQQPRPYCMLQPGDNHGAGLLSGGAQNFLVPRGTSMLYLTLDPNPLYQADPMSEELEACNFFGSVHDDVICMSGADDPGRAESHLGITRTQLVAFAQVPEDLWQTLGRFYFATYAVDWGTLL